MHPLLADYTENMEKAIVVLFRHTYWDAEGIAILLGTDLKWTDRVIKKHCFKHE
jgi:hypothetical protein